MVDLPENELLSAYLDGELSAEEQAEVENLLATSAEARQLVEELRALGSALQSMPAYRLDYDLAESVLRRAERDMLAEPPMPLPKFHQVETGAVPAGRSWVRRLLAPRNFAWPAIAVAVAVVLMINESRQANDSADSSGVAGRSTASDMLIEPLDNQLVMEAAEPAAERPEAGREVPGSALAAGEDAGRPGDPSGQTDPNRPPAPEAPGPGQAVAATDGPRESEPAATEEPKEPGRPALVYQCLLAEGQEKAAEFDEVLVRCGIDPETVQRQGDRVEIELPPRKLAQLVASLRADKRHFARVELVSGNDPAPELVADSVKPGTGRVQMKGSLSVPPNSPADSQASEAASSRDGSGEQETMAPAARIQIRSPDAAESDRAVRVRFLLKAASPPGESNKGTESD